TGSHVLFNGKILGTENTMNAKSNILIFDPNSNQLKKNTFFHFISGVPTSLSYTHEQDGSYLFAVDRSGVIYKIDSQLRPHWKNDKDETGKLLKNSLALDTPTIGDEYIYKSVRHYKNIQSGGPGA